MRPIPQQLSRLVLITGVLVAAYMGARFFLVPPSFGMYGWYRGDALDELADKPLVFAGRVACAECHDDVVRQLSASPHASIGCESCHGPCQAHVEDETSLPTPIANHTFCLDCHRVDPSKPGWFAQIDPRDHGEGEEDCMSCHLPHDPLEMP